MRDEALKLQNPTSINISCTQTFLLGGFTDKQVVQLKTTNHCSAQYRERPDTRRKKGAI